MWVDVATGVGGNSCDGLGESRARCAHISLLVPAVALVQDRNHPASICPRLLLPDQVAQVVLCCLEWAIFKGKNTQC